MHSSNRETPLIGPDPGILDDLFPAFDFARDQFSEALG